MAGDSWHPEVTGDTTAAGYWLNWRVLLCGIWVLCVMLFSLVLIRKYEGVGDGETRQDRRNNIGADQKVGSGVLHDDETWRPCFKGVHPVWLLGFRVFALCLLLVLLIIICLEDKANIYYYYTQWTFTLVTIYFGLGSFLSSKGCYRYHRRVGGDKVDNVEVDSEQGASVASTPGQNSTRPEVKTTSAPNDEHVREKAGAWGYVFQIMFQMNAGAVLLTDCVFWFIIVPFRAINDYSLSFLDINMHTINVILLLVDTALNCLQFPLFRISYFFLLTVIYVIFQWIVHACVKLWWPYPFLDLSSHYAPLWYFTVAGLHFPCYGLFALVIKLKHFLLARWFPQSYQCGR